MKIVANHCYNKTKYLCFVHRKFQRNIHQNGRREKEVNKSCIVPNKAKKKQKKNRKNKSQSWKDQINGDWQLRYKSGEKKNNFTALMPWWEGKYLDRKPVEF